jgi:hypothetical protein
MIPPKNGCRKFLVRSGNKTEYDSGHTETAGAPGRQRWFRTLEGRLKTQIPP